MNMHLLSAGTRGTVLLLVTFVVGAILISGCTTTNPEQGTIQVPTTPQNSAASQNVQKLVLATTTSLYDTGLLDYLEPLFEEKYGVDLLITSQGTGKAIEIAKRGDCDVLAVHSPAQEEAFMQAGYGINRRCFAYNYFIIAPSFLHT